MLPIKAAMFACATIMLLPPRTLSNPYGYYGPYSRTRRDPKAWEQGYGGMVQQSQPLPIVPNVMGNLPSYGSNLDAQGVGLGGAFAAKDQHHSPVLGTGSHGGSMPSLHSPDIGSFQQPQQQYPSQLDNPGGAGIIDPKAPVECLNVACQSLINCINVTMNGTKCCPTCIKYGCICEGYQVYDCQANGFQDGMVPEGKSYAVAGGTTVCSCPPGGGSITCSFHDPTSSRCPELQPNCIKTYARELDGCDVCLMVGCTSDTGEKVEGGMSINKPPCSMCYCPPAGGNLVCGTDQACEAKQNSGLGSTSQAMESSIRELNSMGMAGKTGAGGNGFGGFNGYGGYSDYTGQFGGQDAAGGAGGAPVIPPILPLGGTGGASKSGMDASASLPGAMDAGGKSAAGGMGAYGTYNQGFGLGYPEQFGSYGGYGQGGHGYGNNYLGYGAANTRFADDTGYRGFLQQGSSIPGTGENTDLKSAESALGAIAPDTKDANSQASLGTGGYRYYNQGQLGGYGQQSFVPPLNGAYPYPAQNGESSDAVGVESVPKQPMSVAEGESKSGSSVADPKTAQGSEYQNGYMQPAAGSQNMGYPYQGYQNGYYSQQNGYNMFPNFGGYPNTGSSEYGGYPNAGTGLGANNGQFGAGASNQSPTNADASTSKDSQPSYPQAGLQSQSKASQYNPNLPYRAYDQSQYASVANPYDASKVLSPYQPVDPSLLKPSSPRVYDQGVKTPMAPLESEQAKPTANQDSGTRKIRDNLSVIHKNRLSHEKVARPAPTTRTTTTTTTKAPATVTQKPKAPRRKVSDREQVNYENVLSRCCYRGRQWALSSGSGSCKDITVTVNTYSQICAVAQEKCCLEAKEQQYCQGGMDTARSMAACDVPAELGGTCGGNEFKTCCDCCAMGLKALGLGLHCEVKIFGEPCNHAYQECCQSGRAEPSGTLLPAMPTSTMKKVTPTPSPETPEPTGPMCATDSECQQVCKDTSIGMVCSCRKGYRIHDNNKDCVDVNECVLETHTCTENQFCLNREGSYICQRRISCGTGYELTVRNACEDIDECYLGIHDCFGNMDCENIRGSYRCTPKLCDKGFFTDATGRCIDIDECRSGDYVCPRGATCINTDGAYDCRCPLGMEPDSKKQICQDVDECENGEANCNEGATCINTLGSFICREPPKLRCSPGYQPNKAVTECVDIDECSEGTHTCKSGSTCINVDGGFQCQDPLVCPKGLEPDENQRICLDIDECQDPSLHRCHMGGRCQNLPKTFRCVCDSGYVNAVADDGVPTCADVDECATAIGKKCNYKCRNTPGSYECFCPTGYKLANFGSTCEDIDECAQAESPCGEDETCFNTYGEFRCVALTCPPEYTRITNTRTRSRCQRRSCRGKPRSCLRDPKQISFHNISLANGTKVEKPLFRMSLARSHSTDRYDFQLSAGNDDSMFKVKSSTRVKRPAGIVYTAHELVGPKDYIIDLSLRLYRQRRWSSFVSRLYIFVSEHDF